MNLATRRTAARLGIACATFLAAATLAPGARAEEWTKSYTISGRAQVRVDTNDGGVRIATGDSKQVEFRVIYEGYELNKNLHIDSRQDGDSVQLNARVTGHWGFSWGRGQRGQRIEVRMPKNADLQIDTGDGSVETQPINGHVKIHTGDGSVRAQAINGDVDIDTGDGGITVEGAKGDIQDRWPAGRPQCEDWRRQHRRPRRAWLETNRRLEHPHGGRKRGPGPARRFASQHRCQHE